MSFIYKQPKTKSKKKGRLQKMKATKLTNTELYCGIDTIQVESVSEPKDLQPLPSFITASPQFNKRQNTYYYRLNPDKAYGSSIYNGADYFDTLNYMLNEAGFNSPVKTRIDFRFDSLDENYNELLKLNKLLLSLIAIEFDLKNKYESRDFLELRHLCIRIQNNEIEVENYDKSIQEPTGIVKNRIEFRTKRLNNNTSEKNKEYKEFKEWCKRLDEAVTAKNFNTLCKRLNVALIEVFNEEKKRKGFNIGKFLYKYEDSIFSHRQLAELFAEIGTFKDPAKQATDHKKRNYVEYFSLADVKRYVQKIKHSGLRFFDIKNNVKNGQICTEMNEIKHIV